MDVATKVSEKPIAEILSLLFHHQGDKSSSEKEHLDAIIAYNKSTCYTSENLNSINNKRSLIEMEYLENISMTSQMDVNDDDSEFHPLNLLKLSYEPNPNLPFIADCVDFVKNADGRNVLIAKIPLNVGDVIAIESSFCNGLADDSRFINCSNCMKKVPFALIPCENCTKAMFCSTECKNAATEGFHSYECNVDEITVDGEKLCNRHKIALKFLFKALSLFGGSVESFYKFICSTIGHTIFDFDFSSIHSTQISIQESYQLFAASATTGLIKFSYTEYQRLQLFFHKVLAMFPKMTDIMLFEHFYSIVDFLIKQYQCVMAVDIKTRTKRRIWYGGVYVLRPYMHHSCTSNIFTPILFGKLMFIVQKPIMKGYLLTVNHALDFYDYPKEYRQLISQINCNYICCCVACVNDFPLWKNLIMFENIDLTHDSMNLHQFSDNVSKLYEQFKKNCCYIQSNHINFPNKEMVYLIHINKEILKKINFLSEV